MCSTGLAIVAEQETKRTRRFPTAAQIRLNLNSSNHWSTRRTHALQDSAAYAHLRITKAT